MKYIRYSDEEIDRAKSVPILDVAKNIGFTLIPQGRVFGTKEASSLKLYPDNNSYYRYSTKSGGNVINFVREFSNYDSFQEAIAYLIGDEINQDDKIKNIRIDTIKNIDIEDLKEFKLPEKNKDMKRTYSYLINTRKISKKAIDKCVKNKLIRQDIHNNVMFIGLNDEGVEKYCTLVGTLSNIRWKGEVSGSDKSYSFKILNENTDTVLIFESPIDLLSAKTILEENNLDDKFSYISLGGLSTLALDRVLETNKNIKKIGVMLDNDEKGKETTKNIINNYIDYDIKDFSHLYEGYKDVNEYLITKEEIKLLDTVSNDIELEME